jgi:DNA-binding NarL/FixJ family response regulator
MQRSVLRIVLADDHDVVRRGLRRMLDAHPGWQVCREAANGREAVRMTIELKPQVAVLDLEMPELNGLEATRQIKREVQEIEVLVYSVHETDQVIREVIGAGARGYVPKSDAGQRLIEAIEALSRHKPFFKAKASEALVEDSLRPSSKTPLPAVPPAGRGKSSSSWQRGRSTKKWRHCLASASKR